MGAQVSSEDDCHPNSTFHSESADVARSVGLMFNEFQVVSTVVALPILLAFGVLGNGAFLFTIARVRGMRTTTNFYLANLALADLAFLTLTIAARLGEFAVYGVPNKSPLVGQLGCVLDKLLRYIFHFAGLNFITFISVERYLAVCHPLRHRQISGRGRSVRLVALCWVVAVLLALLVVPSGFRFVQFCVSWAADDPEMSDKFPGIVGRCWSPDGRWANQMLHLTQAVPFVVALFGSAFCYARILAALHRRGGLTNEPRRAVQTRNQVAVMLVANGTIFFLTMICFEVVSVVLFAEGFTDRLLIPEGVRIPLFECNRLLVYVNSAVNPLVYTLANARYRRAFCRAFLPAQCRRGRSRTATISSIATVQDLYQLPGQSHPSVSPATVSHDSNQNHMLRTYCNAGMEYDEETAMD